MFVCSVCTAIHTSYTQLVTNMFKYLRIQVNLDMTDSMGPGILVRHMQNLSYTYDEYLICIRLGPSISSVICKNLSYSGPSYPSSPVFYINILYWYIIFYINSIYFSMTILGDIFLFWKKVKEIFTIYLVMLQPLGTRCGCVCVCGLWVGGVMHLVWNKVEPINVWEVLIDNRFSLLFAVEVTLK